MRLQLRISVVLCLLGYVLTGQVSTSGCYISGALLNPTSTAGCGNSGTNNYCDLSSLYVPAFSPTACGTFTTSGGVSHAKGTSFVLPSGCTATVQAEYGKRNYLGVGATSTGCSNSGMDGSGDSFSITSTGGAVVTESSSINVNVGTCGAYPALGTYTTSTAALTTGCNNADGYLYMEVTGGTVTIAGNSNRADEIITYTLNMSGTCGPSCSSVLPIELISFYGIAHEDQIVLYWVVGSEKNVDYYTIEKSYDGMNFISIGKLKSNSSSLKSEYLFADDYPQKGINYYRLTNHDNDGNFKSFPLIAVDYDLDPKSVWITEQENQVTIFYSSLMKNEIFELCDMTGRIVKEFSAAEFSGQISFDKDNLNGVYILRSVAGIKPINIKITL